MSVIIFDFDTYTIGFVKEVRTKTTSFYMNLKLWEDSMKFTLICGGSSGVGGGPGNYAVMVFRLVSVAGPFGPVNPIRLTRISNEPGSLIWKN
ncbi:hypothetical protein YTPLAS21_00310 [Candidatus Nitrosocosmicus sp.]|nr:hypothetical protein YTPLAS21_00310 [Candidatus Nitrosocosmicus sp.]